MPAAKKGGSARNAKTNNRKSNQKPGPRSKAARQREAEREAHRQIAAIILFAASVLLLFLCFLPGQNVWEILRDVFFGLFGWPMYLVPFLTMFLAVGCATGSLGHKLAVSLPCFAITEAAVHIFTAGDYAGFFPFLSGQYQSGAARHGGGVLGGLLGQPFISLFGGAVAKVLIILIAVVYVMLVTGITLQSILKGMKKAAHTVSQNTEQAILRRQEEQARREQTGDFNIPLDDRRSARRLDFDLITDTPFRPVNGGKDPENKAEKLLDTVKENPAGLPETPPLPEEAPPSPPPVLEEAPEQEPPAEPETPEAPAAPAEPEGEEGEHTEEYRFPPVSLLKKPTRFNSAQSENELRQTGQTLVEALRSFGVKTSIVDISRGPAVTRYELKPETGVKISRITNLADDIALNLAAAGVRIEAPIPGKAAVGIEVPNKAVRLVSMYEMVNSPEFQNAKGSVNVALGRDITGKIVITDIAKMPHLLIAGSTGSGKSVCINSIILSLLYKYTPEEVRLLLIDPKVVELNIYNGIKHLLVPVVSDPRKASGALAWAVTEMLNRYKLFADNNVRDLDSYNEMARLEDRPQVPRTVIIIDELADLMMAAPGEVEDSICRLAQMARAAGMYLIIATQRPSVNVITGVIKANIPSRIAFAVSSQVDSRTILDMGGAEKLLGKGDMLFCPIGSNKPARVQGCFVSDAERESVVDFLKNGAQAEYDESVMEEIQKNTPEEKKTVDGDSSDEIDELLPRAIEIVIDAGQASTAYLQRKLKLGYARAARIIDQMEERGIVGEYAGSKPRQVLITRQQWLEMQNSSSD